MSLGRNPHNRRSSEAAPLHGVFEGLFALGIYHRYLATTNCRSSCLCSCGSAWIPWFCETSSCAYHYRYRCSSSPPCLLSLLLPLPLPLRLDRRRLPRILLFLLALDDLAVFRILHVLRLNKGVRARSDSLTQTKENTNAQRQKTNKKKLENNNKKEQPRAKTGPSFL